jgi:hypothetical protein
LGVAKKKPRQESDKALLATVRKEMALPRIAESAKKEFANLAAARVAGTHP